MSQTLAIGGEAAPDEGERLHVAGVLIGFITGLPQLIFPLFAAIFGARKADSPVLIPIVILGILFFSLFFRWLALTRFRYFVGQDDIRIEKGVLSRSARSIPFERIQDVSIEQKPLARLFGLGEVKFETGGGAGDDARLSFVSMHDAERLRELVRARKSGVVAVPKSEDSVAAQEAPPIFAMDGKRVFTFGLYSFSLVIVAVLGGAAQQLDFLLPFDVWDFEHWIEMAQDHGVSVDMLNAIDWAARLVLVVAAIAGLLIGLVSGVIRISLREYGFRLDHTAKGFRRRRGLLTLSDAVMPVHRVQAAIVETGPIRKRRGWYGLKFVSLAIDSKDETNFVAAPFATLGEIWPIANAAMIDAPDAALAFRKGRFGWWLIRFSAVLPGVAMAMAFTMVFADIGFGQAALLLMLPLLLGLLWWLEWRHYGDHIDRAQIYVRTGWWRQKLMIAPHIKVQTIELSQGPIARRLRLASLHFGIAGGTFEMIALPLETAHAIRDAVIERVSAVDYAAIDQSP